MKLPRLRRSGQPAGSADAQLELPLLDAAGDSASASSPSSGPSGTPGTHNRNLLLGERPLPYTLKRSSRRTIGFTVDDRGLSVTAPRWVRMSDIEAAIAEKQKWIFAKLAEWQQRETTRVLPVMQWQDGATLPFLGKSIALKLESPPGILLFDADAGVLQLALPAHATAQQIRDRVQGWLQGQAKRLFAERLDFYAERLGVRHRSLALSSASTRWGSCTSEGVIRLNWRLMHFPLTLIDYVVAHELAHLREMNHGPRFWETVESIFPEFRDARQQLKNHPPTLLPTF